MRTNEKARSAPFVRTHEGTRAMTLSPVQALRRSVASCLLWEDQFYEGGLPIAKRIADLVRVIAPHDAAAIAIEARNKFKLRHVPLWIAKTLASGVPEQRAVVADILAEVVQRPDEITEMLALYAMEREPSTRKKLNRVANSVKRGLARAFQKFDAYALGKYRGDDDAIKLRDALFLVHAKPKDEAQAEAFKKLIDGTLESPDTWEVALSGGADKKETWTRLINERKLGALALLRNLRNMQEAKVDESVIRQGIVSMNVEKVLPFRFIAAARYAPRLEADLEQAMFRCVAEMPKLPGRTALVVDTSPSMWQAKISQKSDMTRFEAAAALAILCRELCESVEVYAFNERAYAVPARRGYALRDALAATQAGCSAGGLAVEAANEHGYDRIVVLTDGEWHAYKNGHADLGSPAGYAKDVIPAPNAGTDAYLINVASSDRAVGSKRWTMIDGWSEAVFAFIQASEGIEPVVEASTAP